MPDDTPLPEVTTSSRRELRFTLTTPSGARIDSIVMELRQLVAQISRDDDPNEDVMLIVETHTTERVQNPSPF